MMMSFEEQEKKETEYLEKPKDFTDALSIFDEADKTPKKRPAFNTQVILKKEEKRREKVQPRDMLNYSKDITHLFPEHPKSPYLQPGAKYSDYPINVQYTIQFILDLKADMKGEADCSPESLVEREYIALMARAKVTIKDEPGKLDAVLKVFEDAITPDIAKRYGWEEEYVRKGLLEKCVYAMFEGFTRKPQLLRIFEQTLAGRKNGKK
jgi:hypothetical protein